LLLKFIKNIIKKMSERKKKGKEEFLVKESSAGYISDEEVISIIEKRLPEIIRKKPALKAKLKEMFSDVFVEREDMTKILEELRLQRESSDRRFETMDKRFDALINELRLHRETTNKRFEENDKRFAALLNEFRQYREDTNKRFEEVDKRFEENDKRFAALLNEFRQHREDTNKRFDALINELREHRETTNKRFEENDKRFAAFLNEFRQYREDTNKRFDALLNEFRKEREEMRNYVHNVISSIGSRWGEDIESAFREGIREILKKHFGADVKETFINDKEGIIKGYPAYYQIDLLITDDVHIIIDVKAQTSDLDVNKLHKIGMLYEKEKGIKPRLILLTGFVRKKAWEELERASDVEIITSPYEFKLK
jgi:hypothetical protein